MVGAFQVAGRVAVARKLGPEVHRDAAALPVEGAHGEVKSAREDVRADGEIPASAEAGNVQIIGPALRELGEIGRLNAIAGVGVFDWGSQLALEGYGGIGGAADGEIGRWRGGRNH